MNLLLRLIWVLLTARLRGPLRLLDESRLRLLVLPTDLDTNLHMNNGRYLSIMDRGRMDYVMRVGLLRIVIRNRWMPLVGWMPENTRRCMNVAFCLWTKPDAPAACPCARQARRVTSAHSSRISPPPVSCTAAA